MLRLTGKPQNQCTIQTASVRIGWGFFHFQYFYLIFHHPLFSGTLPFLGLSLPLIFLNLFVMFVGCMVHLHSIKFPLRLVISTPILILAISGNLILWFLYSPGFKIVKSLNITIVGVPSFIVGKCLGCVISSFFNCCK